MKRMPRKPIKCYISLNEASDINEDISTIFDNVTLFTEKGFTSDKLFKLLKYESGDRLINYKFPLTTQGIQVTQDNIEDIQTYIDLFTEKFKYKYLALLESEDFEYNPLDNTDVTQNDESTRTPNLSGTITDSLNKTTNTTNNLQDEQTKNLTTTNDLTTTNALKDKTTYDSLKDKTEYNSKVSNEGSITYGKTTTDAVTNDANTNSVVPYDSGSFLSHDKNVHTANSTSTLSGTDNHEDEDTKSGDDTITRSGSFTVDHTGTVKNTGTVKDTGTDTTKHTGTVGKVETGGVTRTTTSAGTEKNEVKMHREGFQPQYSISSRQDMVNKYRDVSNFSTVNIYIQEVANYILLGMYSDLSFC